MTNAMIGKYHSDELRAGGQIDPLGSTAFISWDRLADELRASGSLRPTEIVEMFVIKDSGLEMRLSNSRAALTSETEQKTP